MHDRTRKNRPRVAAAYARRALTRRRLLLDRCPPARESDQRDEQDVDDGGCGHPVDHALRCETVEDGSYYHHAERRAELLKGRDDSARHSRLLGSDLRQ